LWSGLTGCAGAFGSAGGSTDPVTVGYPVERNVRDSADFTARIAAVDSVEVRAHVWADLKRVNFKEGDWWLQPLPIDDDSRAEIPQTGAD
jgi:multidrug efflux pump subunit AcrA (membrane-fusion protein)